MKTATGCLGLILLLSTPAHAKTSTAERFDAVVQVLRGGGLDVTETMVFRFETGTFTELIRELRTRRTDSIDVRDIWMDGRRLTTGGAPGQATVEGTSPIRIRWTFPPATEKATHTFAVRYVVAGAVRQDQGGDVLVWRVPGGQHRWRVESSTIDYQFPAGLDGQATYDEHRATDVRVTTTPLGVRVAARKLGSHGWIETTIVMPPRTILAEPPAWQQARIRQAAKSPAWLGAGAVVFIVGAIVLFAIRQSYDSPPDDLPSAAAGVPNAAAALGWLAGPSPPDALPPALAGVIVDRGRISIEHAAASLLALADRGVIDVEAGKKGALGTRNYVLTRKQETGTLTRHERAALDAVFGSDSHSMTLAKARTHLLRRFAGFKREATADLEAAGLLDADRRATRWRYSRAALALFALAALTVVGCLPLIETFGPWPLAIPAALALGGIVAVSLRAAATPLSNEGIRRAHLWRAYRGYLESLTKPDAAGPAPAADARLPYAVGLGLAHDWAKYLERHPSAAPTWFHASDGAASGHAAFIAAAGAGREESLKSEV